MVCDLWGFGLSELFEKDGDSSQTSSKTHDGFDRSTRNVVKKQVNRRSLNRALGRRGLLGRRSLNRSLGRRGLFVLTWEKIRGESKLAIFDQKPRSLRMYFGFSVDRGGSVQERKLK